MFSTPDDWEMTNDTSLKTACFFFRDKASGYGIQAAGGTLVEKINGDYFNVMGFPLHKFAKAVVQLNSHQPL